MWDNKSKETEYDFPNTHLKQFKGYIQGADYRVNCFLVIGPNISEKSEDNAFKLKVQSGSDTDIALISAEDLKWVAETWKEYSSAGRFSLEVFNYTGILSRGILKRRMKIFL